MTTLHVRPFSLDFGSDNYITQTITFSSTTNIDYCKVKVYKHGIIDSDLTLEVYDNENTLVSSATVLASELNALGEYVWGYVRLDTRFRVNLFRETTIVYNFKFIINGTQTQSAFLGLCNDYEHFTGIDSYAQIELKLYEDVKN
jgi:hypothetical protein